MVTITSDYHQSNLAFYHITCLPYKLSMVLGGHSFKGGTSEGGCFYEKIQFICMLKIIPSLDSKMSAS